MIESVNISDFGFSVYSVNTRELCAYNTKKGFWFFLISRESEMGVCVIWDLLGLRFGYLRENICCIIVFLMKTTLFEINENYAF